LDPGPAATELVVAPIAAEPVARERKTPQRARDRAPKSQRRGMAPGTRRSLRSMSAPRLLALTVLLLGAVAAGGACGGTPERRDRLPAVASAVEGRVSRVVDGDTIDVILGGAPVRVRYIGVDTPETRHPTKAVQCYGHAASDFNTRLVGGERVRLVRDVKQRDGYGRLLAYVYRARDGLFVNSELTRLGYARALSIAPDTRFAERFARLASEAKEARRGLWSAC
jgi:micrococcal nuclease